MLHLDTDIKFIGDDKIRTSLYEDYNRTIKLHTYSSYWSNGPCMHVFVHLVKSAWIVIAEEIHRSEIEVKQEIKLVKTRKF